MTQKNGKNGHPEKPTKPAASPLPAMVIKTSRDVARTMSLLVTELRRGVVTPDVGNAMCNATGKLLKVVEMEHRYGKREGRDEEARGARRLVLA